MSASARHRNRYKTNDLHRIFRIAQALRAIGEVESAVAVWRAEDRAIGLTEAELETSTDAFEHNERRAAQRVLS